VYDPAGNPIKEITARQKTITQTYDALNRLTRRALPGDTTVQENCTGCTNNVATIFARFPYWPTVLPTGSTSTTLIIQPDTARFTYDAAGRMLSAINHDAQVWKSYFANGALHAERDTLHVYDPADTMTSPWGYEHWYTHIYAYDLSGRRISRTDTIAGVGQAAQTYHYNTLGLLDSTTSFSVPNAFAYDAAGRLIHRTTGTGVGESRTYDDDDRMVSRTNNTYNDALGYDARGKITSFTTSINTGRINSYSSETSSMHYDGFGGLVEASQNRGNPIADEYTLDALGNLIQHDQNRNANFAGRATDSLEYDGPHLTSTASNPLSSLRNGGGPLVTTLTTTLPTYDPSGNQIASDTYTQSYNHTSGGTDFFDNAATGESFVRSYYDASERLRVSQRSYFFTDPGSNPRYRMAYQEYFYDALGRRIAMRSQRDSTCTDSGDPTPGWDCAQTMERFIWDGDQLLEELRDYGKWGDDATTLNGNGGSTGVFYGQVAYGYALGLLGPDAPLLLQSGNLGVLVPQASWRGTYEDGTATDGSNIAGTTYSWPGQQTGLYLEPDARIATIRENRWIGNIVEGKADPSGLVYDRNRYYDPTAGRFTQEDPAGIGGGLNLYGYAGADPANNNDPFGLCPWTECLAQGLANWGAGHGGAIGSAALNVGAALNAGLEATGLNAAANAGDKIGKGDIVGGLTDAAILIGGGKVAGAVASRVSGALAGAAASAGDASAEDIVASTRAAGAKVTPHPTNTGEGVAIDFGDGTKVDIRVETHGGLHGNVQRWENGKEVSHTHVRH
jgi:RHS repeat-associated protein